MPRCSFDEKTEREVEVDALRLERGVLGAVDVSVESDAFESDGVSGFDMDTGFFSDERAGGGGSEIAGAEPLLTCRGRLGRGGVETPRGVSGVSECRLRVWYARWEEPRWGVREMCRPMAICSIVGLVACESW